MKLKYIILSLFLMLSFQMTTNAQVVPKLSTYDYMMGTGTNTWFTKINNTIDSLNKAIDSLQAHRARIYVEAGGSSADSTRLLPVGGSPKFTTGRLSIGTVETRSNINASSIRATDSLLLPDFKFVAGSGFEGTMQGFTFENSSTWSDFRMGMTSSYGLHFHGGSSWDTPYNNSSYADMLFGMGRGDGEQDDAGFALRTSGTSPFLRRMTFLTYEKLSRFNFGGSIRINSTTGDTLFTPVAQIDTLIGNARMPYGTSFFVDSLIARRIRRDTTGIAFDSAMWYLRDIEPGVGAASPNHGYVEFRIIPNAQAFNGTSNPTHFKIFADSSNGVIIAKVEFTAKVNSGGGDNYNISSGVYPAANNGFVSAQASPDYIYQANQNGDAVLTFMVPPDGGSTSRKRLAMHINFYGGMAYATSMDLFIRVHYTIPRGNSSTYYIGFYN